MFASEDLPIMIITLIVFIWLGAITFLLARIFQTFTRLTKGVKKEDLKTVLEEVVISLEKSGKEMGELKTQLEELKTDGLKHIQKVGLIRYNPFADTGGNQSFVLALLDGADNGFVITSLHSRETTRVFAKPVVAGKEADFEFSKEEALAVAEAKKRV